MRMRVVPQRRGLLIDLKAGSPRFSWLDFLMWCAVHASGNVHSVPVHCRYFIQVVLDGQIDIFASTQSHRRSQKRSVNASCRRLFAWQELSASFGNGQVKLPPPIYNASK